MNRLRAVGRNVLVKPLEPAKKSGGGILLAESYQQPSGQGVVLSVGGRVRYEDLKPGKIVMFSWIDGRGVEHEGQKCVMLDSGNILGVAE